MDSVLLQLLSCYLYVLSTVIIPLLSFVKSNNNGSGYRSALGCGNRCWCCILTRLSGHLHRASQAEGQ
ncbi:hypothetical protein DdX_06034 [Ditylenchus destructor]|uniref:Uncharacterized protein n=1 Tax=Ditylenchus destructor TaxID=166010 RepID=A0AAD4NC08_9BILA|nr:hypothetical protein DdX_06034 [Ditylenchus destructor]